MTDDLISREAALECCNEMLRKSKPLEKSTSAIELRRAIAALPAAQVQAEPVAPTPPAPDDLDALVARLRGWDHCWPARWLEQDVIKAADAITALRARPATVQVKPLVWVAKWSNDWRGDIFQTDHLWYRRTIVPSNTTPGGVHLLASRSSAIMGDFGTIDAAKAAAQADYDARIRAALVASDPAPACHQPTLPSEDAPQAIMDDHNGIGGETPMSILRRIRATTTIIRAAAVLIEKDAAP